MATNTAGTSARRDPRNLVNTLKLTINYNDAGVSSGIAFANYLPQGAFITNVAVEVVTAFNAGTTNVITVGTNASSYNNIIASGDVTAGSTGYTGPNMATGKFTNGQLVLGRSLTAAGDVQPKATFTQTGTAATAGQAIIVIEYEGGWTN